MSRDLSPLTLPGHQGAKRTRGQSSRDKTDSAFMWKQNHGTIPGVKETQSKPHEVPPHPPRWPLFKKQKITNVGKDAEKRALEHSW